MKLRVNQVAFPHPALTGGGGSGGRKTRRIDFLPGGFTAVTVRTAKFRASFGKGGLSLLRSNCRASTAPGVIKAR